MSDHLTTDLREAKPAAGGVAGLVTALVGWLKEHLPFVVKPVEYTNRKIDHERARTRLVDAQARVLEADAHRRELENEGFSVRSVSIAQRMSAQLLDDSVETPTLEEAAAALRRAAEKLQELGIGIQVSLTPIEQADAVDALPASSDPIVLPASGEESG
jgi:hypothetical protein